MSASKKTFQSFVACYAESASDTKTSIFCLVPLLCLYASGAPHWPVTGFWQYSCLLCLPALYPFKYFMNNLNMALLKPSKFLWIRTNLCVISRRSVSCRCEDKTTDHQRPWSEAACRPPSPLHEQTGQTKWRTMKSTNKWKNWTSRYQTVP